MFKPKMTTDDCYTPPSVYAVIRDWACNEYGIDPAKICAPILPGAAIMSASIIQRVLWCWTTRRFRSCPESADSISIVEFRSSCSLRL